MCRHQFTMVNDMAVCVKCGLTLCENKVVFDRELPSYIAGKKTNRRKKKNGKKQK